MSSEQAKTAFEKWFEREYADAPTAENRGKAIVIWSAALKAAIETVQSEIDKHVWDSRYEYAAVVRDVRNKLESLKKESR